MLPTVNGKSFLKCTTEDIKTILDNQDFRESEYLDYKKSFTLFETPRTETEALNKARAEFRKDICSFANAQGGYIIYGIKEDGKAVPHELIGISILDNNKEVFENTIKNTLQTIQPRSPRYEIAYIPYEERFIVILYVHHDFFTPYAFLENNQDYRVYKRVGSSAKVVTYLELKTMFTQSMTLEKEVENFRLQRISFYQDQKSTIGALKEKFLLLHIIPDTFLDSSYSKPLYYHEDKGAGFSFIFNAFECNSWAIPMVEGLRYPGRGRDTECRLYNNGIAECYYPLTEDLRLKEWFPWEKCWSMVNQVINSYCQKAQHFFDTKRYFVGISIIGCQNHLVEINCWADQQATVDRDELLCISQEIHIGENGCFSEDDQKMLMLNYMLSLGIRSNKALIQLLKDVYDE